MSLDDRTEALRSAGRNALEAQDALLAAWRDLKPEDFASLAGGPDVGLLVRLIERRIYPVPAFGALARIDITAARDVLLSRYLGRAVDPDRKFGGYAFELAAMLDELSQAGGQEALMDLIDQPDFSPEGLADQRVVEAFSDALEIGPSRVPEWIRQAQKGRGRSG
jgi:hypothetical protein